GGAGDDVIAGGGGTDIIDGGEGADTNSFANINAAAESPVGTGVTVTLNADGTGTAEYVAPNGNNIFEEFTGIENIVGSNNNDEIIASGGAANVLSGGAGDDLIVGGGGTDIIDGGEGNDTNSFVNINAAAQSPIGTGVTVSLNADGTGTAEYVAPNGSQIFEEFTGIENVTGSNNNDEIIATGPAGNVIDGLGGDDFIAGGGGTDTLDGGAGFDTNSFSTIGVGVTADLEAQTAVYTLPNGVVINEAFENFEALDGSAQDDRLAGDEASNTLIGNDGDDVLTGRGGDDTLSGGLGDDTLVSDGLDVLDGGEGVDTADFSSFAANTNPNSPSVFNGVIVDLDVNSAGAAGTPGQRGAVLSSPPGAVAVGGVVPAASQLTAVDDVENLIGSAFNDGLFGNNEVNVISAGGGNDVVHGFGGGDFLAGGDGVDTLLFSAAPVGVNVDLNAQLSQAEFDAAAALGAGPTASSGGAGADVLSGFENVTGSTTGDDVIIGDGVGNTLNGQGGEDVLIGRGGDDNLIGGGGDDVLIGNLGDDELTGNQGDDILTGGAGADLLRGGAGEDVLSGGVGADVIIGNGGADLIRAGAGADQVNAGIGADVVRGGVGQDILNGNGGADLIFGGLGADRINGGVGRDELVGGSGADVFVFAANSGADTIRDFRGQDTIEIASGASQFTDLSISSVGSDTLIEFGAADIILSGVDASTVGENDFIFA
ncbi:MAG: calcium-binding protein, partial [Pseudomonadota bacterium]